MKYNIEQGYDKMQTFLYDIKLSKNTEISTEELQLEKIFISKTIKKMMNSVNKKNKKIDVKQLVAHGRQTHKKEYRQPP